MIREFVITEVMLEGVSGDVSGTVTVSSWTGVVESVDCHSFDFRCDANDQQISLGESQTRQATDVVRRTLEADSELCESSDCYYASAAHLDDPASAAMSESQQVLADYLENIRRAEADRESDADSAATSTLPLRRLG